MKKISTPFYLIMMILPVGILVSNVSAQNKVIKEVSAQPTRSLDGSELFHDYCAVCHGPDAKGNGPAAEALKKKPVDLTQLTRKNNGKFPLLSVQSSIKGTNRTAEHGSVDMPMWGRIFTHMAEIQGAGDLRLFALVKYIEQIQAK